MEYVLFRILRLIERELQLYETLNICLEHQQTKITTGRAIDVLVDRIEQKETMTEIADVERDIKEEIVELAGLLKIEAVEPNLTNIVENLNPKYPKICRMFNHLSKKISDHLSNINQLNTNNLKFLENQDAIWKDLIPMFDAWEDYESLFETETESESVNYDISEFEYA